MNTNENYKIEEVEDAMVKKSQVAKTVGIAAATGVFGAGAAVAANTIMNDDKADIELDDPEPETEVTNDDLVDGASAGAENTTIIIEEPKPTHTPTTPTTPETPAEQSNFTVDQQTVIVDQDGEVQGSVTQGTLEGKDYMALDTDGDGKVDEIYYDVDGNGQYDPNEGGKLNPEDQFNVSDFGQATHTEVHHVDIDDPVDPEDIDDPVIVDPGVDDDLDPDLDPENPDEDIDDIDDIDNDLDEDLPEANDDLTDNVTDDTYENDYADNNDDYNNDADISDFA